MKKILLLTACTLALYSCKKCYTCTVDTTITSDGQEPKYMTSTTEYCKKSKKDIKAIEQQGNYIEVYFDVNNTKHYVTTKCR